VQLSADAFDGPAFQADLLANGRTGLSAIDARLAELRAHEITPAFDLSVDSQSKQALGMDRIFLVHCAAQASPERAAARVAGVAGVVFAEPNHIAHAMLTPTDTYYVNQWAHHNTGQAVKYGGGYVGTVD
jgi:hypothetical protein